MAKRNENTVAKSLSPQGPQTVQTPKADIDFESLIAAGIAAVDVKTAKKWRRLKPTPGRERNLLTVLVSLVRNHDPRRAGTPRIKTLSVPARSHFMEDK
jgi:hypothetical protein